MEADHVRVRSAEHFIYMQTSGAEASGVELLIPRQRGYVRFRMRDREPEYYWETH